MLSRLPPPRCDFDLISTTYNNSSVSICLIERAFLCLQKKMNTECFDQIHLCVLRFLGKKAKIVRVKMQRLCAKGFFGFLNKKRIACLKLRFWANDFPQQTLWKMNGSNESKNFCLWFSFINL